MGNIYVYVYSGISLFALAILSTTLRYSMSQPNMFFLIFIITCQVFHVILTTGLVGKSLVAGIGWGSLLAASVAIATMLPNALMPQEYRALLVLPFMVSVSAFPLLIARFIWGWQLTERSTDSIPFRRLRMEDIFSLTACIAAIYILAISSSSRFPYGSSPGSTMLLFLPMIFLSGVFALVSLAIFVIVYLCFRSRLGNGATFFLLLGLFLPHHLFFALGANVEHGFMFFAGAPLCAFGCLLCLLAYKTDGYRLANYGRREQATEELSEADQAYLRDSRRSARWATALLLLAAITASTVAFLMADPSIRERPASQQVD